MNKLDGDKGPSAKRLYKDSLGNMNPCFGSVNQISLHFLQLALLLPGPPLPENDLISVN
jgi:hypothetical protein